MTRNKNHNGICAFCGKPGPVTTEHFVPKGLWVGPRPRFTLTVPTCESCNIGCSGHDEYFRNIMAIGAAGAHPMATAVFKERVLRSFGFRQTWLRDILKTMCDQPMFTPGGLWVGDYPCFGVHEGILDRVCCKIVLGLYYKTRGTPLPKSHGVHIGSRGDRDTLAIMRQLMPSMSPEFGFGDGDNVFLWRFCGDRQDPATTFWILAFYQHVAMVAATLPNKPTTEDRPPAQQAPPLLA